MGGGNERGREEWMEARRGGMREGGKEGERGERGGRGGEGKRERVREDIIRREV